DDIIHLINPKVSQQAAIDVVKRLYENKIITRREEYLMVSVMDREVLAYPLPDRDILRARILTAMLTAIKYAKKEKGGGKMECMECHKRPATLHITQVNNGQKVEQHVCETCAQHKGYTSNHEDSYSLHDLITSLFGADQLGIQQAHRMSKEH